MSLTKVVSIVSQLPPRINGVGDYAFCLAEKLESDFGVETLFVKSEPSSSDSQKKFREVCLEEKSRQGLCKFLEEHQADVILLHYVGYAYSRRGCPYWLVQGLEVWKKKRPSAKIITIFHELYANGKPWESAFWLHPFQKNIVYRLLKISNGGISNSDVTFQILQKFNVCSRLLSIPVFSNIGELPALPDFKSKENSFILFGSADKRREVYAHSLPSLLLWAEKLKVKRIIEIGPERNEKVEGVAGIEIIESGVLSPSEASSLFKQVKYGLIQYPLALLSKSGIFAAYASHGIVPVVLGRHFMNYESNGLKSGEHFLFDISGKMDEERVSANIKNWYQRHDLVYLSSKVVELIKAG